MERNLTYKDAGVDTKEGERAVKLMKEHVKATFKTTCWLTSADSAVSSERRSKG